MLIQVMHALVLLDIGQTLTNLYNNLIKPLDWPVVLIVSGIGGFYWITGHVSDDVRRVGRGKEIIIGAIAGGLIVWFAPDLVGAVKSSLQ